MAVNKPTGDNARRALLRSDLSQKRLLETLLATKRDRSSGEFMPVKTPTKAKKAAKKSKGLRIEKKTARKKTPR